MRSSYRGLLSGNLQGQGECVKIECFIQGNESAMNARFGEITGKVFQSVDRGQPLHHAFIGPHDHVLIAVPGFFAPSIELLLIIIQALQYYHTVMQTGSRSRASSLSLVFHQRSMALPMETVDHAQLFVEILLRQMFEHSGIDETLHEVRTVLRDT